MRVREFRAPRGCFGTLGTDKAFHTGYLANICSTLGSLHHLAVCWRTTAVVSVVAEEILDPQASTQEACLKESALWQLSAISYTCLAEGPGAFLRRLLSLWVIPYLRGACQATHQ